MIPNPRSMTKAEHDAMVARNMLEGVLQERIRLLAVTLGWRYYHTHRAQNSPAGFPDGVMVRGPRLIFEESKREALRYQPSVEQKGWLDDLQGITDLLRASQPIYDAPSIEVYVWRPSDLLSGAIERVLR